MTNMEKTKEILNLVVKSATAIVALAAIWTKVSPEVKRVINPVLDECKRISCAYSESNLAEIEGE